MQGGAGDDSIDGGTGSDIVTYDEAPNGVRVDLAAGKASGWGSDRVSRFEGAEGSRFADVLAGNGVANWLEGGGGNDRIYGRAGRDRLEGQRGRDLLDGGPARDRCLTGERLVHCP